MIYGGKMIGRYKAIIAIYESVMFLLIGYSVTATIFKMIQSEIFVFDWGVLIQSLISHRPLLAGLY